MKNKTKLPSLEFSDSLKFEERVHRLVVQMKNCIANNQPVNLSMPTHTEITQALHRMVYFSGREEEKKLQIEYNDGSKGKPFPVYMLYKAQEKWDWDPAPENHLCIGTLSFRHLNLDSYVDLYLLRDSETRYLSQALIENEAYKKMCELLHSQAVADQTHITIYQTGLEPLIVGMYRAIVYYLRERNKPDQKALRIRPVYRIDEDRPGVSQGISLKTNDIWGTKNL